MKQMIMAVLGMVLGIAFGRWQLMRWKLWSRQRGIVLIGSMGLIFLVGGYWMYQYQYYDLKIIRYWVLMYGLVLLGMIDCEKRIVPNKALLAMLGVRTVFMVAEIALYPSLFREIMLSSLLGMIGGGLLFLLAGRIVGQGVGMGDVKLMGVVGYYLGTRVLMSDLIIVLTLTILGGLIVLITKKGSLRSEIPFAPFVAMGTIITILIGF